MNRRELLIAFAATSAAPFFLRASHAAPAPPRADPSRILTPEKFGATGDGKARDDDAFDAMLAAIHKDGGNVTIRCRPGAVYALTSDKFLRVGNVTLDGQGCTFTGGGRWEINGDPGIAGGKPTVSNVHFRNFQLKEVGAFNPSKGPRFNWVEDSSLSNIRKTGTTGTYFNFHMSRNCHATKLTGIGSNKGFGFLMFHCNDCSLSDSSFTDDQSGGTHPIVVQIKGGNGNRVQKVTAQKVLGAPSMAVFYCRGDAPYHAAHDLGTYPYANGKSWDVPDPDRETRNATWEDCTATDCGGNNAFLFQESSNCSFVRCVSIRSGSFRAVATENGHERGAHFIDCRSEQSHRDAFNFLGQGSDSPVSDTSLENVVITDPGGAGVRLRFAARPRLNNVTISNAMAEGLVIDDSDTPDLARITVSGSRKNGVAISRTRGLPVSLAERIKSTGNRLQDLRNDH